MTLIDLLRLLSDLGLAALAIIFLFAEYANWLLDRHKRHWVAMSICLMFSTIFAVRAFNDANLIDETLSRTVLAILWFFTLILITAWGGMILIAKWKLALTTKRFIREKNDAAIDQGDTSAGDILGDSDHPGGGDSPRND